MTDQKKATLGISPYRGHGHWLVEPLRRADLVDGSMGLITFGLPRKLVREIYATWPTAGFHKRLVQLELTRLRTHPWSPLPRQEDFIGAARRELAGLVEITAPEAGTHLVGWLPRRIDDQKAIKKAAENGVEAKALSTYCLEESGRGGLVLGYGAFTKNQTRRWHAETRYSVT